MDVETGQTKVTKVWAAHDCGKALNPLAVEGQIIGSCHMGLGQVLSEEMKYGRTGHLLNPDLLDYKIPTVHEMPDVTPIIVESNDPEGPFGAKEAGEGPLLPILPAVVNAVYDAIGVRVSELPITPDRLYKAIERRCKSEGIEEPSDMAPPRLEFTPCRRLCKAGQLITPKGIRKEGLPIAHLPITMGLFSDWTLKFQETNKTLDGPR